MPFVLLESFIAQLPRIEADETLRLAEAVAFAFGSMKEADSKKWVEQQRALASGEPLPKRKRATNQEIREIFGGPPMPQPASSSPKPQ